MVESKRIREILLFGGGYKAKLHWISEENVAWSDKGEYSYSVLAESCPEQNIVAEMFISSRQNFKAMGEKYKERYANLILISLLGICDRLLDFFANTLS